MATRAPASFRTCETTGFRVERHGQRLVLAYGVTGVLLLAAGGIMALLIAVQRLDAVQMSDELWYRLLAAHGTTMLLFWLLFFEVAALYWGSTMLLNARMRAPRIAWAVFGIMVLGVLLTEYDMLVGGTPVMFTAYPPLETTPVYYLGILMVAGGVLGAVILFFANIIGAKRDGTYTGSLPLVVYGLAAAAIIAVYALGTGAVAYGLLLLKSVGLIDSVDPAVYRLLFWGIGHGAQQVNLAAMVAVWYALAGLVLGARPVNEALSRIAFVLLIAFIHLGAVHHLLVDPGLGTSHRLMNTSYLLYLAVLASLIHAFSIPAGMEVAQRERGFDRGLLTWLIRGPWREPGFSALVISVVVFGFIAGVTGVLMGQMQLNMLIHNTLFVPGHFHGTVVAGTTLAFMGMAYYLVPLVSGRKLASVAIARWQPYVFGAGVTLFVMAMLWAGQLGVPRRVSDLNYDIPPLGVDLFREGPPQIAMLIVLVGAVFAVTGGVMFVWVMVATLMSKRTEQPLAALRLAFVRPDAAGPPAEGYAVHGKRRFEAPGTFVLVLVFLAWFVAMYGLAHLNLSRAWPVG